MLIAYKPTKHKRALQRHVEPKASRPHAASALVTRPSKRRKPASKMAMPSVSSLSPLAMSYVKTLEDPWEFPPIKIGWGAMVPTSLATGYLRGGFQVNADGSFNIVIQPDVTNFIMYNTAGAAAVPVYTVKPCTNAPAITNVLSEARVVSAGVRVFCLFPQTSAPGVLFAGSVSGVTQTGATNYFNPNSLSGQGNASLGIGSLGARITIRPEDPFSYSFTPNTITGYSGTVVPSFTKGFIAGLGFPAGTVVWYEAVMNLEGLPTEGNTSLGLNGDAAVDPGLSAYFPSIERTWSAISSVLGNASVMDGVAGLAGSMNPNLVQGIRSVQSAFGGGTHFKSRMAAGSNSRSQGVQNTVVVEEMKEDALGSGATRGYWTKI